jgi:phosphoribosylpyrophosphate synthetase
VLSGTAVERVSASALKELVITDTIQATEAPPPQPRFAFSPSPR